MGKVFFITGTGTGVGKTVFTALWLNHLRNNGVDAIGLKPFCSGNRNDAKILAAFQDKTGGIEEINPWFVPEPVAPGVYLKKPTLKVAVRWVGGWRRVREAVLVEGVGGLMVPVTMEWTVLDLIEGVRPDGVVLVARNELGVINQVLLSILALEGRGLTEILVILVDGKKREMKEDISSGTNAGMIRDWSGKRVLEWPNLGHFTGEIGSLKKISKKFQKPLAKVLGSDSFCPFFNRGLRVRAG